MCRERETQPSYPSLAEGSARWPVFGNILCSANLGRSFRSRGARGGGSHPDCSHGGGPALTAPMGNPNEPQCWKAQTAASAETL